MIFGSARGIGEEPYDPRKWHYAYAWRPVQLIDRRWAWLQKLERISWWAHEIPVNAPRTWLRDWCYREITRNDQAR